MIIALTGTIGSGKGEAAKYLQEKKFQYLVYSDVLREIAKQKCIEPTRENLHRIGRKIKEEGHDPGFLSKRLLKKITEKDAVVDGVRNVGEIQELKRHARTFVIGITASQRLRFQRIVLRKREGDPATFAAFKRIDNIENRGRTKGQEINACLRHADITIHNNGSIKELHGKIDRFLDSIVSKSHAQ
ncbi:dephospho-CoA kinase [Candidatus Woesearchaeota archaeon]|nr:dephospho-CoA kinase [Candidatus Woesearchaeota archaeon]